MGVVAGEKLKVLFLPKWYPSQEDIQNGIFVKRHAEAISTFSEVTVLHLQPSQHRGFSKETILSGSLKEIICYYPSGQGKMLGAIHYIFTICREVYRLSLSGYTPDLIHVHILLRPLVIGFFLSCIWSIPFIVTEHWTGYMNRGYEKQHFLKKLISKLLMQSAGRVTAVSSKLASQLKHYFMVEAYVIPNIISLPSSPVRSDKYQRHREFRVLTVADLRDEIKNISGIIYSFSQILLKIPTATLTIVGDGHDRERLESLADDLRISSKVSFAGRMAQEEVRDYYERHDLLVVNSFHETFSMVTAEAILSGLPVVITRCGGPEEFVTDQDGIKITPGSNEQLIEAILTVEENYATYNLAKTQKRIANNFSKQKVSQDFQELYKKVC